VHHERSFPLAQVLLNPTITVDFPPCGLSVTPHAFRMNHI
jgi:hypothetical protein